MMMMMMPTILLLLFLLIIIIIIIDIKFQPQNTQCFKKNVTMLKLGARTRSLFIRE